MFDIKDKNVLITGGASGLGRLLAVESAKRNASNIILVDINEQGLKEDFVTAQKKAGNPLYSQLFDLVETISPFERKKSEIFIA